MATTQSKKRSRSVSIETEDADDSKKIAALRVERRKLRTLKAHSKNPRKHPKKGSDEWEALRVSLADQYFDPIVFNERNGMLISGHLRKKILIDDGFVEADCVIVDCDEETPVAFLAYVRQPHQHAKNLMRGHRTVVMPDFQGMGLGVKLSDWLANHLVQKGWRYTSVTSHSAMIHYRLKSPDWKCIRRASHVAKGSKNAKIHAAAGSQQRLTYSFEYIGKKNKS